MLLLGGSKMNIGAAILPLFVLVAACILRRCAGSSEPLMPTGPGGKPDPLGATFRINKISVVWQKAIKTVSESLLPSLYAELVVQDRLEVELKKLTGEGGDEDGTQDDIMRRRFLNILRQFGLHDLYGVVNTKRPGSSAGGPAGPSGPLDEEGLETALARDERLAQLWAKAQIAGFSGSELEGLRSEFMHHARRQTEYEQLKRDIEQLERMSDNSIEKRVKTGKVEGAEAEALMAKHAEMKRVYKSLMASYEILNQRTNSHPLPTSDFDDPRIRELFMIALKSNLTEGELASFREELGHFQHRIKKQEFFAKEAERVKAEMVRQGGTDYPPAYRDLEEKAQEHTSKVKKWYAALKSRLLGSGQVHREL